MDEPFGALDPIIRHKAQDDLLAIQRRFGTTIVLVTHDMDEAIRMGDQVAILREGKVQQVGTPREVYESPASRFVADFIGSVNLLEGSVLAADEAEAEVAIGDRAAVLRAAVAEPVAAGAPVNIAIRPEKLALAAEPPAAGANRLQGRVQAVAYLGDTSVYHVELPWGQAVRASVANAARHPVAAFARGDEVWLGFAPSSAIVLPR
jgi:putrescine transport system ATP-binding protein